MPKISVPKSAGDEIVLNHAGDVKKYRVNDGQVTVAEDDVATFLAAVDGAKADAKTTAKAESDDGGSPAVAKEGK